MSRSEPALSAHARSGDSDALIVVTTTPALASAVDQLAVDVVRFGPSSHVVADVVAAASAGTRAGPVRPVLVAATADTVLSVLPLVASLRCALRADHVAVALTDPGQDVDIVWGHVFRGGLLVHSSTSASGEPTLVDQIAEATGAATSSTPLRIVRDGPDALRSALTYEATVGNAYTLVDGADPADLTAVAGATVHRPLTVGTPALIPSLREALVREHRYV